MIQINAQQMAAFARAGEARFENKMLRHVREVWADRCAALSEEAIRASIQQARQRSLAYGISSERDVACFLDLMYALGFDFDHSSQILVKTLGNLSNTDSMSSVTLPGRSMA